MKLHTSTIGWGIGIGLMTGLCAGGGVFYLLYFFHWAMHFTISACSRKCKNVDPYEICAHACILLVGAVFAFLPLMIAYSWGFYTGIHLLILPIAYSLVILYLIFVYISYKKNKKLHPNLVVFGNNHKRMTKDAKEQAHLRQYKNKFVYDWLKSIDLLNYYTVFIESGYQSELDINTITQKNCQKMGIIDKNHIKTILTKNKNIHSYTLDKENIEAVGTNTPSINNNTLALSVGEVNGSEIVEVDVPQDEPDELQVEGLPQAQMAPPSDQPIEGM